MKYPTGVIDSSHKYFSWPSMGLWSSWTLKGYSHSASQTTLLSLLNWSVPVVASAPRREGVQLGTARGWFHPHRVSHCLPYKPVQWDPRREGVQLGTARGWFHLPCVPLPSIQTCTVRSQAGGCSAGNSQRLIPSTVCPTAFHTNLYSEIPQNQVIGELTNLTTKIITLLEFFNFVSEISRLR
jgi:hypothetical protein